MAGFEPDAPQGPMFDVSAETDIIDEAPAWPKVVGTTSIVWGGLNIMCAGCGAASLMMPMVLASQMQTAFPDGLPPALQNPPLLIWVSYAIGLLISVFLIASGIVLVMRNPIARPLHLVYAVAAMVSAAVGMYAGWELQSEMNDWMRQHPDTAFARQQNSAGGAVGQQAGFIIAVVLGFAWPLFCLVWFGAVKRDSQEIARGVESLV